MLGLIIIKCKKLTLQSKPVETVINTVDTAFYTIHVVAFLLSPLKSWLLKEDRAIKPRKITIDVMKTTGG